MPKKLIGVLFSAIAALVIFAGVVLVGQTIGLSGRVKNVPPPTMTIKVYFGNSAQNPNAEDCSKVFSVSREVPQTADAARAALSALLAGPTPVEKTAGFYTAINDGVKINSLTVADGVARVDFDYQLERQVGGSCRVGLIRSQIAATLKQFSGINDVIISVEGRVDEALQP